MVCVLFKKIKVLNILISIFLTFYLITLIRILESFFNKR